MILFAVIIIASETGTDVTPVYVTVGVLTVLVTLIGIFVGGIIKNTKEGRDDRAVAVANERAAALRWQEELVACRHESEAARVQRESEHRTEIRDLQNQWNQNEAFYRRRISELETRFLGGVQGVQPPNSSALPNSPTGEQQ